MTWEGIAKAKRLRAKRLGMAIKQLAHFAIQKKSL
jgi:hypothetical protein